MAAVCWSIALSLLWAVSTQKFSSSVRPIVVYLLLPLTAHSANFRLFLHVCCSCLLFRQQTRVVTSCTCIDTSPSVFLSCFRCSPLGLHREIFPLLAVWLSLFLHMGSSHLNPAHLSRSFLSLFCAAGSFCFPQLHSWILDHFFLVYDLTGLNF